ncbi:alpha/beta fold hydrolase [Crossiella cryophila]|uniref:Pimeloyl-ACP methyl ester carboxylesterase n=1 Tax=Crossiella cryophila TaxID=43355 RepID=A0A7W7C6S9_9PSEU|nr:alpha/beta hydrolase [Crossiella cryophila]MBB4675583.1 pimeloyl-ACP methyl ester carboxylesterase [Crossiella cryophila]
MTQAAALPLGEHVRVAGRSLFTHRSGRGGPPVVFLPGASMVGLHYLNLHNRIAEHTTCVLYDRAGTGFSERIPLPRTAAEVADELRELLRVSGISGPYLLVAHSLGGVYARRFAQRYPDQVAGLVSLEGAHEDWDDYMPPELRIQHGAADAPMPEPSTEIIQRFRELITAKLADWPAEIRELLIERQLDLEWMRIGALERSNLATVFAELRRGGPIPDVPYLLYTANGIDPSQRLFLSEELLRVQGERKLAMYRALAAAAPRGEHRVLAHGSHSWLHMDQPEEVVEGILDVLKRV